MLMWLMLVAQPLTLERAWELALEGPRWKAMREELALREAEVLEGAYWENPGMVLDVEEAPQGRLQDGLRSLRVSWALPLSPTTWYARRSVRLTRAQNRLLEEAMEVDLRAQVARAFVAAYVARERLALEQHRLAILDTLLAYTRRRLEKGRSHPAELARLQARRARQQVIVEEAHVDVVRADQELRSFFPEGMSFDSLAFTMELPLPRDSLQEAIRSVLYESPRLLALSREIDRQKALKGKADWAAVPNPELEGGPQRGPEGDFITIGLSLSLPVFERNQAERAFRRARLRQVQYAFAASKIQMERLIEAAWERFRHAWEHQRRLRTEILPSLETSFESYREGYMRGRFDLTTLLDVQDELLETHLQALDVEVRAWDAWLEIYETLGTKEVWP